MTSDRPTEHATDSAPAASPGEVDTAVVNIEGPAHGGSVVARHNGRVVFVRGALPGEKDVKITFDPLPARTRRADQEPRFRRAVSTDVGIPSPHRVPQQCPAALRGAGCCDLDFVDAQGSLAFKRAVVADQLRRIGRIDVRTPDTDSAGEHGSDGADSGTEKPLVEAHSLAPYTGYRTRVRLGVGEDGRAGLRHRQSHRIVAADEDGCAQWSPALRHAIAEHIVRAGRRFTPGNEVLVAVGDAPVGHSDRGTPHDSADDADSATPAASTPHTGSSVQAGDAPDAAFSIWEVPATRPTGGRDRHRHGARRHGNRASGRPSGRLERHVAGSAEVSYRVGETRWNVRPQAFWQAHAAAPQYYADLLRDMLGSPVSPSLLRGTEPGVDVHTEPPTESSAWDLYGGAGVFASVLRDYATAVDCVDTGSATTSAGREAFDVAAATVPSHAGTDSSGVSASADVRFVDGDVASSLPALRTRGGLRAVVLDPPRTGAGIDVVAEVASYAPEHVVHIGCDPATAARDLAAWVKSGYRVNRLVAVDAFGLTHHVELVAHLVPSRGRETAAQQTEQETEQP